MLSISLNGFDAVKRTLINLQKQVAFAASKALNRVAAAIQKMEVEKELPTHLHLRGQWFKPRTKFGINLSKFASKNSLIAVVGTQANWLLLVEHGGTKRTTKALAIPSPNIDTSRVRKREEKPRPLIKRGGGFVVGASGRRGVYVRTGKGRRDLKLMYFFRPSARVPHLLHFYESGRALVNQIYLQYFGEELNKAILSAK